MANKNFKDVLYLLKLSKNENILSKQAHISLFKYFQIYKYLFFNQKLKFPKNFSYFEKSIVNYEFKLNINNPVSFDALEYYYFIDTLSKRNINKFFSIFENSPINKLWNLSISNKFIHSVNNAIKVMIPVRNYFSQYFILKSESKSNLLPKKIFLISKSLKKQLVKDNSHISNLYKNGPNLRLNVINNNNNKKNKLIVFFTSILDFETIKILNLLNHIKYDVSFDCIVKFHPSYELLKRPDLLIHLPKFFKVNQNISIHDLSSDSFVISGMSSILIDSLELNLKSIYIDTNFYLSLNPMLDKFKNNKLFNIVSNLNELNKVLNNKIPTKEIRITKPKIYNYPNSTNVNNLFK